MKKKLSDCPRFLAIKDMRNQKGFKRYAGNIKVCALKKSHNQSIEELMSPEVQQLNRELDFISYSNSLYCGRFKDEKEVVKYLKKKDKLNRIYQKKVRKK